MINKNVIVINTKDKALIIKYMNIVSNNEQCFVFPANESVSRAIFIF